MADTGRGAAYSQLYHHVVLPRKVPGKADHNIHQLESDLLDRLLVAVKTLSANVPPQHFTPVDAVRLALSKCKDLHIDGNIDQRRLVEELRQLGEGQSLLLYVTEQNVALLLFKQLDDAGAPAVVFEAFEVSATCSKVLASEGALQWDFPGQAISVPLDVYTEPDFQESLAAFLDQASFESIKEFAAVTYKAHAPLVEIRDTPEPTLITSILRSILEANGTPCNPTLLRKRVRDTVVFEKAHKPWRRSPFYLAFRVAIQRHLYRLLGPEIGRLYYKVTMCLFLSDFLDNGVLHLPPEACHFLRQKLGRRLSKLEVDCGNSVRHRAEYAALLKAFTSTFEKTLASAARYLESAWEGHKNKRRRRIHPLPRFANSRDLDLSLISSAPVFNSALQWKGHGFVSTTRSAAELLGRYEDTNVNKPMTDVIARFTALSKFDESNLKPFRNRHGLHNDPHVRCQDLSHRIRTAIVTFGDAYNDYPVLLSKQLLTIMELWVLMDKAAVQVYNHLSSYHPSFQPDILDHLQLESMDEMLRVQAIQSYLVTRCSGTSRIDAPTIFTDSIADSFAVCHYDKTAASEGLEALRKTIEGDAEAVRVGKEEEWQKKTKEHEKLVQEKAGLSCVGFTVNAQGESKHNGRCRWHELRWKAKQIQIEAFEYPLPKSEPDIKAIVFELACPATFAAYRDATWSIISAFAHPKDDNTGDPILSMREYRGLKTYASGATHKVTLVSTTKSHLHSHYRTWNFPVTFKQVCKEYGLGRSRYFDTGSKLWTAKFSTHSFSFLLGLKLPRLSPYHHFQQKHNSWPSSNQVLSSQTSCPPDHNVHEFIAWQDLLVGTFSRWPTFLRELASANLNFSSEATWALVTRLVSQVGPASSDNALRDVHSVFQDSTFCEELLNQVKQRFSAIRGNWREPLQMDILISLAIKTLTSSPDKGIHAKAIALLEPIRDATNAWCGALREIGNQSSVGVSVFAIWASVLCKRTFYALSQHLDADSSLYQTAMGTFLTASVKMQNNLAGSFTELPLVLRTVLVRDLVEAFEIRQLVQDAILTSPSMLLVALSGIWPVPAKYSVLQYTVGPDPHTWIVLNLEFPEYSCTTCIHYHVVSGTLLIDGQPLGVLPPEYHKWPIIKELFGDRAFSIFPSHLPGMSLVASDLMPNEHWVHFGFRDGALVIRAQYQGSVLELMNRDIFCRYLPPGQFDLPNPLINGCYHWLDVDRSILEIRQDGPWKSKRNNWRLDLRSRRAMRNGTALVDPHSELFTKVAQNFYRFEYASEIVVTQPAGAAEGRGSLIVALKRLELDFFVNRRGMLQSPQLGATIVESRYQDAGTWYGLESKIVICSVKNRHQRSILIPEGASEYQRDGQHISITIGNSGSYLRFGLNDLLGRVECPTEPGMLYTKALWHAITSHFLPDSLTGRTGAEEALQYLGTAAYIPWTPLSPQAAALLLQLAKLTPCREYYPPDRSNMETVFWDSGLTSIVQDDRYRGLVETLLQRSSNLRLFDVNTASEAASPQCPPGNPHLEHRALTRIYAYAAKKDMVYRSRDTRVATDACSRVTSMTKALSAWSEHMSNTKDLPSILQRFPIIGGHVRDFNMIQFTDRLNIDYGAEWGALCQTAIASQHVDRFRLMFMLAPMAFSADADMELLQVVISFAIMKDLKGLVHPSVPSYSHFNPGEVPLADDLAEMMSGAAVPLVIGKKERPGRLEARQSAHEALVTRGCTDLAESLVAQWPNKHIDLDRLAVVNAAHLDRDEAIELITSHWTRLTENCELADYLEQVQLVLDRHCVDAHELLARDMSQLQLASNRLNTYPARKRGHEMPTIQSLLQRSIVVMEKTIDTLSRSETTAIASTPHNGQSRKAAFLISGVPNEIKELRKIAVALSNSESTVQCRYGVELEQSIDALSDHLATPEMQLSPFNPIALSSDLSKSRNQVFQTLKHVCDSLKKEDRRFRWLQHAGFWPKVTLTALLTELRSNAGIKFGAGMKEALVDLGVAVTTYQRFLRMDNASRKSQSQQLHDERSNIGHENWTPLDNVDWLLLEIDGDIMLRSEQVEVAEATISPTSDRNAVLQLLMGKGKTSCILPMVAIVLANQQNLFRVIVPRPLLLQSAQVLQAKVGGLLNRQVMHMPFSRKTPTHYGLTQIYANLHDHIQKNNGIVLALPEHILSFKLSGLQRLCDGKLDEAKQMLEIQRWLDTRSRDVMDECDVSLAVRTQLIYPSGSQMTVDGHPLRWQTVQVLLRLVEAYLPSLRSAFPKSVELVRRSGGGFPLIYFLREDVQDSLTAALVQAVCKGNTTILPGTLITDQNLLKTYLSEEEISAEVVFHVTNMFKDKLHLMNVARHLRGLLGGSILLGTMKKRWNVQYGLHPAREPVAVPYLAKGVPSATAEWGHPDVAIILTILSFYYQGISISQLKQALEELLKLDEPNIEYEKWATNQLPEGLRDHRSINVEDLIQLRELHQKIQYNTHLHDFYLNAVVFPKHAKQFGTKLEASGWDLVPSNLHHEDRVKTTGFSGTNDSRHQLPLTIKQSDLPGLAHTNAEVLAYLLEPRNRRYVGMIDNFGTRLSEKGLLKRLGLLHIRILIDAGAQILEHNNRSLARAWLKLDEHASGVVFFDELHRPMVIFGNAHEMPLVASPFAEDLKDCLVYLDESHCRGTDLKLPPNARAALTLGPNLTKDALVQAAMRLRLLGKSQSVTFFAPPEVHQGIVDIRNAHETYQPDSFDVIRWLLKQSCDAIEQLEPSYIHQGVEFLCRTQAALEYPNVIENTKERTRFLSVLQLQESQTLKDLFEPNFQPKHRANVNIFDPSLRGYVDELYQRNDNFEEDISSVRISAFQEVEQEREMEIQVESVREIQKPHHYEAYDVGELHRTIEYFAKTGRLKDGIDSPFYFPMWQVLKKTAIGLKRKVIIATHEDTVDHLFVSLRFTQTVVTKKTNDDFLRPCQWVLYCPATETGILVSHEEANLLIPVLRDRKRKTRCHLIVYSAPVTRRMLQFNDLNFYAVPPLPEGFKAPTSFKVELGIFAGRLHFGWDEYEALLGYLGTRATVDPTSMSDDGATKLGAFTKNPLAFMHDWLAVRRKGQDLEHTPMGFITTGKPLTADHPFFQAADEDNTELDSKMKAAAIAARLGEDEDSDDENEHEHEHLFRGDDEYDTDESDGSDDDELFDEKDNTFFEGAAYVENMKVVSSTPRTEPAE